MNNRLYSEYSGKKMLNDVVILRLSLIFLLVWTHVFAPFNGSWASIEGLNLTYPKWIVSIISAARMPGLVFVSGYLLGYTANRKDNTLSFYSMILKKLKRLILPCVIFSAIYYLLFMDINEKWEVIVYSLINGSGHLWFLPMLFWCFVITWIVEKIKINYKIIIIIACGLALLPGFDLPFRIAKTFQFYVYFYIGFALQRGFIDIKFYRYKLGSIILMVSAYSLLFILNYNYINNIMHISGGVILKILTYSIANGIRLSLGILGIMIIYFTAHIIIIPKFNIPTILVMLSSYCYGVYIFHQFILRGIYYYSVLPEIIPSTLLVWTIFPLTILLSMLLTHCTLKTKIGRKLIG